MLLSVSVIAADAAPAAVPEMVETVRTAVVCIENRLEAGRTRIGTGFFVGPGLIASSAHVFSETGRIRIRQADGAVSGAVVVALDAAADIALLRTERAGAGYLRLSDRADLVAGEPVFTIGCPFGLEQSLSQGVVSNARRVIRGRELIQTDVLANAGNSGGPLVDARGEVVGIVHAIVADAPKISFAVMAQQARKVLVRAGLDPDFAERDDLRELWHRALTEPDAGRRVRLYEEVLRRYPDLGEANYNLGIEFFKTADYRTARHHFEQAIAKRPGFYQAYVNLGLTLHKLGRHREAKDVLIKAISISPDFGTAFLNLGIVYSEGLGDLGSARRSFERFIELAPDAAEAAEVRSWLKRNS